MISVGTFVQSAGGTMGRLVAYSGTGLRAYLLTQHGTVTVWTTGLVPVAKATNSEEFRAPGA